MSTQFKKTIMISLAILFVIVTCVAIVYMVRKPEVVTPTPTPRAVVTPTPAPVEVFEVSPELAKCETSFVVACGSTPPSSTPSASPSGTPPVYASPSPSTPPSAALECVAKRMYSDDTRNKAGFYYIEQEILDTNTLENGQVILYNVVTRNTGGNSVPDTTITDKLSTNLSYIDGDSGCSYDATSRVVTCSIGTLASGSEAQRTFRVKVNVAGTSTSVANTAEVASTNGQRDSCSVEIDATGKVIVPPPEAPTALPQAGIFEVTAGTLGIGLLLLILGGLGLLLI